MLAVYLIVAWLHPTSPRHLFPSLPCLQMALERRLEEWMQLFPEWERCDVCVHTAFLRYYAAGMPGNLFGVHVDDSLYTIVICLHTWDHQEGARVSWH